MFASQIFSPLSRGGWFLYLFPARWRGRSLLRALTEHRPQSEIGLIFACAVSEHEGSAMPPHLLFFLRLQQLVALFENAEDGLRRTGIQAEPAALQAA